MSTGMIHLKRKDGYLFHKKCGNKVMLVSNPCNWTPDDEAFKNGEPTPREIKENDVTPWNSVCGFYCPECGSMVEVWVDQEDVI